jgi:hypothetical protein
MRCIPVVCTPENNKNNYLEKRHKIIGSKIIGSKIIGTKIIGPKINGSY